MAKLIGDGWLKVGGYGWLSWRRWVAKMIWRRVAKLVEMGGQVGGDGSLSWRRWAGKLIWSWVAKLEEMGG